MDDAQFKLLREIGKNNIRTNYKLHGRDIPVDLWNKLKDRRICDECKQTFNMTLYIHHIIPIRAGGSNDKNNLMTVCYVCHQKLDAEQEKQYPIDKKLEQKDIIILNILIEASESINKIIDVLNKCDKYEYQGRLINIKNKCRSVIKSINALKEEL